MDALIIYPHIHLCKEKSGDYVTVSKNDSILSYTSDSVAIKENLTVAHTKGNQYGLKEVNGHTINDKSIVYTIKKDSTILYPHSLVIRKMKNGKEIYQTGLHSAKINNAAEQCTKGAVDTTDVPADTLRLDLGL